MAKKSEPSPLILSTTTPLIPPTRATNPLPSRTTTTTATNCGHSLQSTKTIITNPEPSLPSLTTTTINYPYPPSKVTVIASERKKSNCRYYKSTHCKQQRSSLSSSNSSTVELRTKKSISNNAKHCKQNSSESPHRLNNNTTKLHSNRLHRSRFNDREKQNARAANASTINPEEVKQDMYGLARRLQMKTIGLHEDNELQRSDDSSVDSDALIQGRILKDNIIAQPMTSSSSTNDSADEDVVTLYLHLKSSFDLTNTNATTTNDNKRYIPNSKVRRVQMYAVMENSSSSAPTIVVTIEDANNYYENFETIKT
ncbi:unnamed protein product [Rotaria magnacalcarata]